MTSGLNTNDPTLVAAFRSALLHQLEVIVVICLLVLLAYWLLRARRAAAASQPSPRRGVRAEPKARRFLRISFGVLWIVDGILQLQPQMAGGLPSEVVQPGAAASPRWVQDVVNAGGTIWSFHPVEAAAAAVWIQLGAGIWLIAAEAGWWSRLGGLASAAWGLVVWVFGEAFGGIFAPGLTWLMGAPGAVFLYVAAGALLALPARAWEGPRAGRLLLAGTGTFWLGMAVLQAWPGRGYWQGGADGTLTGMIGDMAGLVQPRPQQAMIDAMLSLVSAHGWAVNLAAVVALAACGAALLTGVTTLRGRPAVLRVAVPASIAFCLVVWVLVQDLGVPGGLGTDPNSMVPWAALVWAGYRSATQPVVLSPERIGPAPQWSPSSRSVVSLGALAVVLTGAGPLAVAAASWHADPVIARAMSGAATRVDRPAPDFRLVSQSGRPVSIASLRGRVTLLTFLDPACTTDCPVGTEMKEAGVLLGGEDDRVQFVAIAASQSRYGLPQVRALNAREGLDTVPNWLFLTGSAARLQRAWGAYGIYVSHMSPGASSVMRDLVFVIDASGRIRQEILDNPMAGTVSVRSSYAALLAGAARQVLGS